MNKTSSSRWLAFFAAVVFTTPPLADDPALHQAAQQPPIQLGTSGGNIHDISTLYCCSGTLGALVKDAQDKLHILSNNHVLGRANQAQIGEEVNQPGMIDQNCQPAGVLATVSKIAPLQFGNGPKAPKNLVDAAMAATDSSKVSASIIGIAATSSEIRSPSLGLPVQKSGRTTGLTKGTISAVNVSVKVGYSDTCGGAANRVALFVNQLQISSSTFSAGGDSGSVIYEDTPATTPAKAVGLLFAGSASTTLANPIGEVLTALGGVTMVAGSTGGGTGETSGGGGGGTATPVGVNCITYKTQSGKSGDRDLLITIVARDDNNQPVSSATVAITLKLNGQTYGNGSAATDASGAVTFSARNAPSGDYETIVNNITRQGFAFDEVDVVNLFRKGSPSQTQFGACDPAGAAANAAHTASAVERVQKIKEKHADDLLAIDKVVGHGIGLGANGEPVIEIYLENENAAARARIPAHVENVPVRVIVTGAFTAF